MDIETLGVFGIGTLGLALVVAFEHLIMMMMCCNLLKTVMVVG